MIPRNPLHLPSSTAFARALRPQTRCFRRIALKPVPSPTPFVPDPTTFLTLIGRNMATHAAKFPSWAALFTLTSPQLREAGLEPARARRYLLRWREKFRQGEFGVGGDLTRVVDGVAELRIVEVAAGGKAKAKEDGGVSEGTPMSLSLARRAGMKRVVVNVTPGAGEEEVGAVAREVEKGLAKPVEGMKIKNINDIAGKNVRLLKGLGRAQLQVMEGLWEHKRGQKVDGGERRKDMVRAKRRAEENKKN